MVLLRAFKCLHGNRCLTTKKIGLINTGNVRRIIFLPSRDRLHRDLDAPRRLLGLLPGVARPLVLVDQQADLVRPGGKINLVNR